MIESQYSKMLGCRRDPPDRRDYPGRMRLPRFRQLLPETFSRRDKLTEVKAQGPFPGCVGFAVAAVKEYQELRQRPWSPFEDSCEMWIYWGAKQRDEWPGEGGTSIRAALKTLQRDGMPTEKGWPYVPKAGPDHTPPTKPHWWAYGIARWGGIGAYYRLEELREAQEWVYENGPAVVGMAVGRTAFEPIQHTGVPGDSYVALPSEVVGGHAVVLTGWDSRYDLLEFRNSWGSGWGDGGYGYISREYYEKHVWDVWGVLDD